MSVQHSPVPEKNKTDGPSSQQVESIFEKNGTEAATDGDYSGATAKSDPKEIALVKKLDYRIMPILWAMVRGSHEGLSILLT